MNIHCCWENTILQQSTFDSTLKQTVSIDNHEVHCLQNLKYCVTDGACRIQFFLLIIFPMNLQFWVTFLLKTIFIFIVAFFDVSTHLHFIIFTCCKSKKRAKRRATANLSFLERNQALFWDQIQVFFFFFSKIYILFREQRPSQFIYLKMSFCINLCY